MALFTMEDAWDSAALLPPRDPVARAAWAAYEAASYAWAATVVAAGWLPAPGPLEEGARAAALSAGTARVRADGRLWVSLPIPHTDPRRGALAPDDAVRMSYVVWTEGAVRRGGVVGSTPAPVATVPRRGRKPPYERLVRGQSTLALARPPPAAGV